MSSWSPVLRFVNEPSDRYPFSHGSNLIALDDDRLVCVWFAGSSEGHADTAILMADCNRSRFHDPWRGPLWSEPVAIAHEDGQAVGNPVLFCESVNDWWLFYSTFPPRRGNNTTVRYQTSRDGGLSWSPAQTLTERLGYWTRHPVAILSDGAWALPLSYQYERPPVSMLWRTCDRGLHWTESRITGSENRIHPSLVRLEEGRVQAYLRDCESHCVYRADSYDNGKSWVSVQPMPLPNNNSSVQALRLQNGAIALAFNDQQWRKRRSPLTLAASRDGGQTWPVRKDLIPYLDLDAALAQFSYPSIVQMTDQSLHMSFTYKTDCIAHAVLSESSLLQPDSRLVPRVADIFNRAGYGARTLRSGEPVYADDKKDLLRTLPSWLVGQLTICPFNTEESRMNAADHYLQFRLGAAATVIVAYDADARRLPAWLLGFRLLESEVATTRGRFHLYATEMPAGEHWLGGNLQAPALGAKRMYFVFVMPTQP